MKKMRVAIVGAGMRVREAIIPALNEIEEIELAVICDIWDESIKKALAVAKNQPEVITDYTTLLNRSDIDGIILVTPNYLHAQMAEVILKGKKPLYLEKPMGISLKDCQKIQDSAEETKTPLMIGMQLRYADSYAKMKDLLDKGVIGNLRMMHYTLYRSPLRGGWENWRMDKNLSGGSIIEVTVHQLDLFNWFSGGKNARVSAFAGKETIYSDINMWDETVLIMEYENGIRANIEFSLFAPVPFDRNGLYLLGDKAVMYHRDNKIIIKEFGQKGASQEIESPGTVNSDIHCFKGFYNLVVNGKKPLTTLLAGKMAVAASLAAEKSIAEGRAVSYEEIWM